MVLFPLLAAVLTLVSMPLCMRLARAFSLYDVPDRVRKAHERKIPFTGGLGIIFATGAAIALDFALSGKDLQSTLARPDFSLYLYFAEASIIIFILGIVDDIKDLSYATKFIYQFLASFLIILGAYTSKILPWVAAIPQTNVLINTFSAIISMLWIVGVTNAVNIIDGMDGLAAGTVSISSITLGILGMLWSNQTIPAVMFILAASLLAFLVFNFHPARIFMGNTGSMVIGFLISVCSWILISYGPMKSTTPLVPAIILGLPVLDTILAFFRRLLKGKNPFSADMFHIHHMLRYRLQLSQRRTVLVLYAISFVYSGVGVAVALVDASTGWVLIGLLVAASFVLLHRLGYVHLIASSPTETMNAAPTPVRRNGTHPAQSSLSTSIHDPKV